LWIWLAGELWFEWSHSDQYGYGMFVPFLCAYLVWLRVEDRPVPQSWGSNGLAMTIFCIVALLQYPTAVLFAANADWRLLAWGEAALALAASMLLLARWGGAPWIKHFLPALLLFLFAVPWPSRVQIALVDHLMTFVASVVAEILNLFGYDAIRQGHIIRVHGIDVSVEEACSGVRSIQSTIMAGWLVGEWWRFRALGRAGLLAWAFTVAVLFNLARTFLLSWIAASHGADTMERWHDTAGYLVFGFSFATVLLGAWLARPRQFIAKAAIADDASRPGWLPAGACLALLIILVGAWPACAAWYAARNPDLSTLHRWKLDLASAAPGAKPATPPKGLDQILFYHDGIFSSWTDSDGLVWQLFNFSWNSARAAQLGGVHSPESCLPAVGWSQTKQGPNLVWQNGPVKIIFNTYEFTAYEFGDKPRSVFVFYGQWDPAGYPYYEKTGRERADRLLDAWTGDTKQGKQLLEIAIMRAPSLEDATALVHHFLDRGIVIVPYQDVR